MGGEGHGTRLPSIGTVTAKQTILTLQLYVILLRVHKDILEIVPVLLVLILMNA